MPLSLVLMGMSDMVCDAKAQNKYMKKSIETNNFVLHNRVLLNAIHVNYLQVTTKCMTRGKKQIYFLCII